MAGDNDETPGMIPRRSMSALSALWWSGLQAMKRRFEQNTFNLSQNSLPFDQLGADLKREF